MNRRGRESGITFVELLVVLAILLLLIVILLPVYSAAKKRGRRTTCLSNLKQIAMAMHLYAEDNNELLPQCLNRRHDDQGKSDDWDSPERLYHALFLKITDPALMFCPEDVYARQDIQVFGVNHKFSSYWFNMRPSEGYLTIAGVVYGGAVVIQPADYPMVRDSNLGYDETVNGMKAYGCQHMGMVNIMYVDGHVETKNAQGGQIQK